MIKNLHKGPVSAPKYLKSGRARSLPIHECYMPSDWKEMGKFSVMVSRKHSNGNITAAVMLVDICCTGVKDAFFLFNEPEAEFRELLARHEAMEQAMQLFDYNLVHNVVFGALEFAADYGIKPHKDWPLVSMILEKDDDNIPLMEVPLGQNEVPVLLYSSEDPKADYYLRQLKAHAGEDNFILVGEDEIFLDEDEDPELTDDELFVGDYMAWTKGEWADFFQEVDTESLTPFDPVYEHIYDKLEYKPKLLAGEFDDLELPGEVELKTGPVPEEKFLEKRKVRKLTKQFHQLDEEATPQELQNAINDLQEAIERWPDQPRLCDMLSMAYVFAEDFTKASEVNLEVRQKFPDHFFGKLIQAKLLLEGDRADEIEAIFGGLSPAAAFSGRTSVNVREYVPFLTILSIYWLKKEDVPRAWHLMQMVYDLDPEETVELDQMHFFLLSAHMVGQVNLLIEEMQSDKKLLEHAASVLGAGKTQED